MRFMDRCINGGSGDCFVNWSNNCHCSRHNCQDICSVIIELLCESFCESKFVEFIRKTMMFLWILQRSLRSRKLLWTLDRMITEQSHLWIEIHTSTMWPATASWRLRTMITGTVESSQIFIQKEKHGYDGLLVNFAVLAIYILAKCGHNDQREDTVGTILWIWNNERYDSSTVAPPEKKTKLSWRKCSSALDMLFQTA